MRQSMESQRVGHNWVTQQQQERIHAELRDHDKNAAGILSVSLRRNRQDTHVAEKKDYCQKKRNIT